MNYTGDKWEKEGNKIVVFQRGIIAICPSPLNGGVLEFLANADLIAAAPGMYEALKAISSRRVFDQQPYEIANKVLSKAEGK